MYTKDSKIKKACEWESAQGAYIQNIYFLLIIYTVFFPPSLVPLHWCVLTGYFVLPLRLLGKMGSWVITVPMKSVTEMISFISWSYALTRLLAVCVPCYHVWLCFLTSTLVLLLKTGQKKGTVWNAWILKTVLKSLWFQVAEKQQVKPGSLSLLFLILLYKLSFYMCVLICIMKMW